MGLRDGGEKPAAVLPLVFALGWLPAVIAGAFARAAAGPSRVISAAGDPGRLAAAGLGISLAILGAGYAAAIRRPPSQRGLLAACALALLGALALPVLFSADIYAYAYYGDQALHGRNPYGHGAAPGHDPLAAAAVAAWDGHVPPRCVYGPLAVGIAALADLAGSAAVWAPVHGAIAGQRLAAAVAYAVFVGLTLALTRDPRMRAALTLHPVVVWSAAEGHNDAALVALVCAGFADEDRRRWWFAAAAWLKAPALLAFSACRRGPLALAALSVAVAGYLPLAAAFAAAPAVAAAPPAAWQSPLGLAAAGIGRVPACLTALALVAAVGWAVRRLPPVERTAALALATWMLLPNAYPWYAWWIVPLAARRVGSIWCGALLVAALFAPARTAIDAIFPASNTIDGVAAFHVRMIALEFLPPLLFLAGSAWLRRGVAVPAAIAAVLAVLACPIAAPGQTAPPSSTPAPAPAPQTSASPGGSTVPAPQPQAPPPTPTPLPTQPPLATPPPSPPPAPSPTATVPGPAVNPAPAASVAIPPAVAPPAPSRTPNPFTYVITPTPVPVTSPDGPHIIEVLLNDRVIRAGGPLNVRVLTSTNVVGVEARALGRFIAIPQSSPGLFSLAYTMPGGIPFWLLNRNYDIVIAAATADGRQTTVSFPMLLAR